MNGVSSTATVHEDYYTIEEDYLDIVLAAKEDFEREIMPMTRRAIKEMIAEADPEFVRTCRTEYLTGALEKLTLEKERFVSLYEDSTKRDLASINRLYFGDKVLKISSEIDKLQRQISALRHPEHKGQIAEEMIQRAKECPFTEIVEFRRNTATCPFHADKTPSMHLYEKDNRTHCFSCHRSFDTIGFMMERDGLTFVEAVKYLA